MKKETIQAGTGSSVVWDKLEEWARRRIQGAWQDVLEAEADRG